MPMTSGGPRSADASRLAHVVARAYEVRRLSHDGLRLVLDVNVGTRHRLRQVYTVDYRLVALTQ
jgi:hypothetical protein